MNRTEGWTIEQITQRLARIKNKGFMPVPTGEYRQDEGVVGQILEREFGITENNLRIRDLGTFELKGIRRRSSTLTLCHLTTSSGLKPIDIFNRFGYKRPSKRDKNILKKKLFTTVKGTNPNSLGLVLRTSGEYAIEMLHGNDFICRWELKDSIEKMDKVILVLADKQGKTASEEETFHYVEAHLYDGLKGLPQLVGTGALVVDFCIDQVVGSSRGPHDRGPHIRIYKRKLDGAYRSVHALL